MRSSVRPVHVRMVQVRASWRIILSARSSLSRSRLYRSSDMRMGNPSLFLAVEASAEFGINKPQIGMARQARLQQHICRDQGGMSVTIEYPSAGVEPRAPWQSGEVLSTALRVSLRDLNVRFLACMRSLPEDELAALGFTTNVTRLLRAIEVESMSVIAAAFRQHEYWQTLYTGAVAARSARLPSKAGPDYASEYDALTEMALFFAWHLATTNALATRLVLGMSAATSAVIRSSTLPALAGVARGQQRLLRPRWPQRTLYWRRLLAITPQSSFEETSSAQLVGIQLMATQECLEDAATVRARTDARSPRSTSR